MSAANEHGAELIAEQAEASERVRGRRPCQQSFIPSQEASCVAGFHSVSPEHAIDSLTRAALHPSPRCQTAVEAVVQPPHSATQSAIPLGV